MNKIWLQFISVFLCFALLAPVVERSLHSWEHRNDAHCTSSSKHLHSLEHTCSLCDYELPAQEAGILFSGLKYYFRESKQITFYTPIFSPGSVIFTTSRAPPVA